MKPYLLVVTGVLGSGKSTVCQLLKRRGFELITADKITRELYVKDAAGYKAIQDFFGEEFVGKVEVNRVRLREHVLANEEALSQLDSLMRPLIFDSIRRQIAALVQAEKIAVEVFSCTQTELEGLAYDELRVDATDEVIAKRIEISQRGLLPNEVYKWLSHQRETLAPAEFTLKNSGSEKQLATLLDTFLASRL